MKYCRRGQRNRDSEYSTQLNDIHTSKIESVTTKEFSRINLPFKGLIYRTSIQTAKR